MHNLSNSKIQKSHKTNRIVALNKNDYEVMMKTALAGCKEVLRINYSTTMQQKFNKELNNIVDKYNAETRRQLIKCSCSEAWPKSPKGFQRS